MWLVVLGAMGIASIPVSLFFRKAAKEKAEREARRRAELIRERLAEEPNVEPRKREIRLGRSAGR
jgi:hypothetical protein